MAEAYTKVWPHQRLALQILTDPTKLVVQAANALSLQKDAYKALTQAFETFAKENGFSNLGFAYAMELVSGFVIATPNDFIEDLPDTPTVEQVTGQGTTDDSNIEESEFDEEQDGEEEEEQEEEEGEGQELGEERESEEEPKLDFPDYM